MTYVVTVETHTPEGAPELDELHRVGATALLRQGFDAVAGIEGPDGTDVDLIDTLVEVHPSGAVLQVFVDATSLELAEEAVGSVTEEVLERSELLADWVVRSSEVKLHTDRARESLEAAEGPDAPPSDLEARRARHTAGAASAAERAADGTDHRAGFRATAGRLRAFGPDAFGVRLPEQGPARGEADAGAPRGGTAAVAEGVGEPGTDRGGAAGSATAGVSPESAEVAAGAIVHAAELLVDELFDDVQVLAEEDANAAACEGHLWHLGDLPPRYALQYDERFARRFLVTAVALTTRFTDGGFRRLGCVAEQLVLKLLLEQAHITLDLYDLLDDGVVAALEVFAAGVYEDRDFEWLYDDSMDGIDEDPAAESLGITPMAFGTWFMPFHEDRYVHPYAADDPPGETADPAA
ncbi:hypothetical protein EAO71_33870 [Streptomyces sp. ms191]|uniref:hypothetical protein n=1 Tax=Streptomyces sp. ms191 TaxID=1827978 RepID=UPI0011CEA9F0|nr:hypothetical protein [Streptomyces sp. ms191]TXS19603.1 hypothetical protein EAO71_33870 [Streptomyces sp. ms191]